MKVSINGTENRHLGKVHLVTNIHNLKVDVILKVRYIKLANIDRKLDEDSGQNLLTFVHFIIFVILFNKYKF